MRDAASVWGVDPGGCPLGAVQTGPITATCGGNGNGVIGPALSSWDYFANGSNGEEVEWMRFWQHLSNAQLIEGRYSTRGDMRIPEDWAYAPLQMQSGSIAGCSQGAYTIIAGHSAFFIPTAKATSNMVFMAGIRDCNNGNGFNYLPAFTSADAKRIDSKTDDGKAFTGKITGTARPMHDYCAFEATGEYRSDNYVGMDGAEWIGCALYFDTAF